MNDIITNGLAAAALCFGFCTQDETLDTAGEMEDVEHDHVEGEVEEENRWSQQPN